MGAGEARGPGLSRVPLGGGASGVFRLVQSRRRGRERNRPFAALTPTRQDLFPGRGRLWSRPRPALLFFLPAEKHLAGPGPAGCPPALLRLRASPSPEHPPAQAPPPGKAVAGRHAMNHAILTAETFTCAYPGLRGRDHGRGIDATSMGVAGSAGAVKRRCSGRARPGGTTSSRRSNRGCLVRPGVPGAEQVSHRDSCRVPGSVR